MCCKARSGERRLGVVLCALAEEGYHDADRDGDDNHA